MISIYCDESCHLEKDMSDIMVLGSVYCDIDIKKKVNEDIRNIKVKHGLSSWFEMKWTKVSITKLEFYKEVIDYFFDNNLYFRAIIAKNKSKLNNDLYNNGSYDLWYYKMYYLLLDAIVKPVNEYKIFIDIKDTKGGPRVNTLKDVLCNNIYDFKGEVVKDIKQVDSKESEILQLADLFIGSLSYYNRGLTNKNNGKKLLVEYIINHHKINMRNKTGRHEKKFNIFVWEPRR